MRRSRVQSEAVGSTIALSRADRAMTREQISRRAGVSRDTVRRVEEGDPAVQLDTLCAVGSAVGLDVVVRAYPARPLSLRDSGQLHVAELLCSLAHASWKPVLELAAGDHGEAADIGFFGAREIIDTEIDRLILDLQAQHRRNSRKREYLAAHHQRPVRLVMVIEDTKRNRAALAAHVAFVRTVLPAGSREVLTALRTGKPLGRDGLLWLRRRQPPRR